MLLQSVRGRAGEAIAGSVFAELNGLAASAPADELRRFRTQLVADQYRVPYAVASAAIPPASDVLDWGCGDGHFSMYLLGAGHRVTAFTLQHRPHALRAFAPDRAAGLRFVQADASEPTRLPFEPESFDAVACVGVLEHVRETGGDERASLAEIRRVLRPGGRFLCFHLPSRGSYIEAASRAIARAKGRSTGFHAYRYSAPEVRSLCAEAGLEVVAVGSYGAIPRNSLERLPNWLKSPGFRTLLNRLDDALAPALRGLCQNRYFVAQRPADS